MGSKTEYTIQQKWSPLRRKYTKKWEIRETHSKRLVYVGSTYSACVKWLKRKYKK